MKTLVAVLFLVASVHADMLLAGNTNPGTSYVTIAAGNPLYVGFDVTMANFDLTAIDVNIKPNDQLAAGEIIAIGLYENGASILSPIDMWYASPPSGAITTLDSSNSVISHWPYTLVPQEQYWLVASVSGTTPYSWLADSASNPVFSVFGQDPPGVSGVPEPYSWLPWLAMGAGLFFIVFGITLDRKEL